MWTFLTRDSYLHYTRNGEKRQSASRDKAYRHRTYPPDGVDGGGVGRGVFVGRGTGVFVGRGVSIGGCVGGVVGRGVSGRRDVGAGVFVGGIGVGVRVRRRVGVAGGVAVSVGAGGVMKG